MSVLAKAAKKPFYVASESYKFCRLYPLSHTDLPEAEMVTVLEANDAFVEAFLVGLSDEMGLIEKSAD